MSTSKKAKKAVATPAANPPKPAISAGVVAFAEPALQMFDTIDGVIDLLAPRFTAVGGRVTGLATQVAVWLATPRQQVHRSTISSWVKALRDMGLNDAAIAEIVKAECAEHSAEAVRLDSVVAVLQGLQAFVPFLKDALGDVLPSSPPTP